jgi:hypothetical protein
VQETEEVLFFVSHWVQGTEEVLVSRNKLRERQPEVRNTISNRAKTLA